MIQGNFLQITAGFNTKFPFSETDYPTKAKESDMHYTTGGWTDGFTPFQTALSGSET